MDAQRTLSLNEESRAIVVAEQSRTLAVQTEDRTLLPCEGSVSTIKTFGKDDYELLDYTADYTDELTALSDTIATSTWIVPSDSAENMGTTAVELKDSITVDYSLTSPSPKYRSSTSGAVSIGATSKTTAIKLKSGTLGETYLVMNRITTAAGRQYARVFNLLIERRGC
jgi:hypothetical protein